MKKSKNLLKKPQITNQNLFISELEKTIKKYNTLSEPLIIFNLLIGF